MKPLAWIKQNPETLEAELCFDKPVKYWATVISNPDIPLYRVKELTDEQIVGIRMTTEGDIKAFARAIIEEATNYE